jgi:negative regulator of flagellin synthesis FlgM
MRVEQPRSNQTQSAETQGPRKTNRATNGEQGSSAAKTSGAATAGSASADISAKGKEFAKTKAVANDAPDVREAKIAELKRRIAEGKYKVDGQAVASRMVDDHLEMGGLD